MDARLFKPNYYIDKDEAVAHLLVNGKISRVHIVLERNTTLVQTFRSVAGTVHAPIMHLGQCDVVAVRRTEITHHNCLSDYLGRAYGDFRIQDVAALIRAREERQREGARREAAARQQAARSRDI